VSRVVEGDYWRSAIFCCYCAYIVVYCMNSHFCPHDVHAHGYRIWLLLFLLLLLLLLFMICVLHQQWSSFVVVVTQSATCFCPALMFVFVAWQRNHRAGQSRHSTRSISYSIRVSPCALLCWRAVKMNKMMTMTLTINASSKLCWLNHQIGLHNVSG